MENNGAVDALAELIRGAKLTDQQRQELLRLSRQREDGVVYKAKKTGPYAHCKFGDMVRVKYPDGAEDVMTVSRSGPLILRLSRQSAETIKERREQGFYRAKDPNFIAARDAKFNSEPGQQK